MDGRLSSIEDHDGDSTTTTRCTWDAERLSQTREAVSGGEPDRVRSYVYDGAGHLLGWSLEGLPESAGSPGGHRDFVVSSSEDGRVVERALAPPPALLSVQVYEGPCTPLLFDPCDPVMTFLAE